MTPLRIDKIGEQSHLADSAQFSRAKMLHVRHSDSFATMVSRARHRFKSQVDKNLTWYLPLEHLNAVTEAHVRQPGCQIVSAPLASLHGAVCCSPPPAVVISKPLKTQLPLSDMSLGSGVHDHDIENV